MFYINETGYDSMTVKYLYLHIHNGPWLHICIYIYIYIYNMTTWVIHLEQYLAQMGNTE